MDRLAGGSDRDLAGLGVLHSEFALENVIESVLVEERLPAVGRFEIGARPQLVDQSADNLVSPVDDIGHLAGLAVAPQESGSVLVPNDGRTLEGRGALRCILWRRGGGHRCLAPPAGRQAPAGLAWFLKYYLHDVIKDPTGTQA